ncbi:MAG: hypothetical protein U5K37_03950 [Natrialbaceae archaeon]|nr:hypothetical protein [Natrialbaceae archaeon]
MLGKSNTPSGDDASRSQSEILGVVLLLGMVIMIGIALMIFGMALLDELESSSTQENVHSSLDQTLHTLSTVSADSDQVRELPLAKQGDIDILEKGRIEAGWYGASDMVSGNPPPVSSLSSNDCYWKEEPIGAMEYSYQDRTAVIQGGGIWEKRGDAWVMYRAPNINFVGENVSTMRISMNVMADRPKRRYRPGQYHSESGGDRVVRYRNHPPVISTDRISSSNWKPTIQTPGTITSTRKPTWEPQMELAFPEVVM